MLGRMLREKLIMIHFYGIYKQFYIIHKDKNGNILY